MTPTEIFAYRRLHQRYEHANNPQDRETAASGMLLARLMSGLSHFEILRRADNQDTRKVHLTAMEFEFPQEAEA